MTRGMIEPVEHFTPSEVCVRCIDRLSAAHLFFMVWLYAVSYFCWFHIRQPCCAAYASTLVIKKNYLRRTACLTMTIPADFLLHKKDYGWLATNYRITPIRRYQCLPNQPVKGIYKTIKDQVYQFTAVRANGGGAPFSFSTGYANGDKLLAALKKPAPALESWQATLNVPPAPNVPGPAVPPGPGVLCPFNAQLLELLNLFCLKHTLDPTKPSGQLFVTLNQNPGVQYDQGALAINTILTKYQETSSALVAWLQGVVAPAQTKNYNFSLLSTYLQGLSPPPAVIAI